MINLPLSMFWHLPRLHWGSNQEPPASQPSPQETELPLPHLRQWQAVSYLVGLIKDPNSFLLALHHRFRVQSGRFGALRCNLWDLSPF